MTEQRVNVAGREMILVSDNEKAGTPGANAPHTSYALQRVEQARELGAFRELIKDLKGVKSVCELFGGSGWHSAAIQDLIKPKRHVVKDIAPTCVESIQRSLPGVEVERRDSYQYAREGFDKERFDLVHADFNQYTPLRGVHDKLYKDVIPAIFKAAKKYAIITDSAIFGVARFEKNRTAYTKFFGQPVVDVETYYMAVSDYHRTKHGRVITRVLIWDSLASMYLMEQDDKPRDFTITYQKTSPVIELIK
jgi:hypothetical protein